EKVQIIRNSNFYGSEGILEDNMNREDGWVDDPSDEWPKRSQMEKDTLENHGDRDSACTEDKPSHRQKTDPQPKLIVQLVQQIQQVQQIQSQQQALVQILKYKDRKDAVPNQDNIGEQEIIQEKLVSLQGEKKIWNI
ncbi:MAG: hypothetical protein EZS28_013988, partial [Streblomastix strix]